MQTTLLTVHAFEGYQDVMNITISIYPYNLLYYYYMVHYYTQKNAFCVTSLKTSLCQLGKTAVYC